jgi:serine/threonine protein phosphatase PrpC
VIVCSKCRTENQLESKFCARCGAPLPQAAPTKPLVSNDLPAASRPTMPLVETDFPPDLVDLTPEIYPSDAGWGEEVTRLSLPFEPLPVGAFVGPYIVNQLLEESAEVNRYYVRDEEETAVYILKESAQWEILRTELELIGLGIQGEGLQPPVYAFQQRIGVTRYYVLLPAAGDIIGNLAVLHDQQIGFGPIDARRISVEGDEAYFHNFADCLLSANSQQYAQEVHQLAAMLYMLLTGEKAYTPQNNLPVILKPLFDQLLAQMQPMPAANLAQELSQLVEQIRRPASLDLRVGRQTDVGMVRQLNEDSLCTMELVWNNQSQNKAVGVYIVADGMGGHEGGEIASGLTIKAIMQLATEELFAPTTRGDAPDYDVWLKKAVEAANTAVYERSKQSHNDMGTTVVMALIAGNEAHIAHVGDSRAYHISQKEIEQITTDHSLVERLVATGQISREEARYHPQSNVIYRTIGDKAKIEVDITTVHIAPGEHLLLCSDGLSGMVTDERIHEIIRQAPSPQSACAELIHAANAAGGDDNITVVIVKSETSV